MATLDSVLHNCELFEIVVPASVARRTFADVAAVCPDREVELTEEGHIIVMAPTGLESGYLSGEVFFQLALWARQNGTGKAFDASAGFYVTPQQNRSPDAAAPDSPIEKQTDFVDGTGSVTGFRLDLRRVWAGL